MVCKFERENQKFILIFLEFFKNSCTVTVSVKLSLIPPTPGHAALAKLTCSLLHVFSLSAFSTGSQTAVPHMAITSTNSFSMCVGCFAISFSSVQFSILSSFCRILPLYLGASQVLLVVKSLPANAGDIRDMGLIPGWEDLLEEAAPCSNPLRCSCLEEPGRLQSIRLQS